MRDNFQTDYNSKTKSLKQQELFLVSKIENNILNLHFSDQVFLQKLTMTQKLNILRHSSNS